jgi:hypothetical protein
MLVMKELGWFFPKAGGGWGVGLAMG